MISDFLEASAIAIVGGADGQTSIYISDMRTFVCIAVLFLFTFAFVTIALIRSIKRRHKVRSVVYGIILALFLLVVLAYVATSIYSYVSLKNIQ